ncbi:MAG TPA: hypothetical protein EYN67_06415, partial [Flavobacteriales bacterium]|nr:hypothetical protein [Flavobacteriales bacterium]
MTVSSKLRKGLSSGDAPNVADVFSTYLYDGTGAAQTITNGIDLATEGGMVWIKGREDSTMNHWISDTERTSTDLLATNLTAAEDSVANSVTGFNADGFSLGSAYQVNEAAPNEAYASWTFRKAPRFFDVVTYTGNGVAGREIAHDLGCDVGFMVVKTTNTTSDWHAYHKSLGATKRILFNSTAPAVVLTEWNDTEPTSTVFTVGNTQDVNTLNNTYVAYLFAHDPLGENDDGMIACGSFTTGSVSTDVEETIGWQPQYVLMKNADSVSQWFIVDTMRGWVSEDTNSANSLYANLPNSEATGNSVKPTSTGFIIPSDNLGTAQNWIYMAIRAPMMVEPESGTEVFAIDTAT